MTGNTVTLMAGGDIAPEIGPVDKVAELVVPILREADLRFGQCETLYSERASDPQYIHAHGCQAPKDASVWETAGIDIVSMASNHAMKMGAEGLLDTIKLFQGMGKHVIGAGRTIDEARAPAIVERNNVKIAFLAYCSVLPEGQVATRDKAGVAPMRAHTYYQRGGGDPNEEMQPGTPPTIFTLPHEADLRTLQEDIVRAKKLADAVVLSLHWGLHFLPKAIADYQPLVAHAAIDAGADLILGHHPHCLKAIEVYKGKVCFYSLGNFMMTSNVKLIKPSNWNRWNLHWYRMDADYLPPKGIYYFPPDSRNTMIAKAVFSKAGVEKVSFLPAYINPQAQPRVIPPSEPQFQESLEYVEWLSDQFAHKFRVDRNEIVVDTGNEHVLEVVGGIVAGSK